LKILKITFEVCNELTLNIILFKLNLISCLANAYDKFMTNNVKIEHLNVDSFLKFIKELVILIFTN
jgi:hypothetical protein